MRLYIGLPSLIQMSAMGFGSSGSEVLICRSEVPEISEECISAMRSIRTERKKERRRQWRSNKWEF